MDIAPVKSAYPSADTGVREVDQSSKHERADITKPELDEGSPEVVVEPPFSIYSTPEKKWISSVASFGAMFSTLSSYIYFPALVPMATELHVSLTLINLTVTSYMIVAGIAPAFMGDIADQGGRRPAYILMFALVFGSNIGLALQKSYPALLVLRMIQSAGASGSYGAAYGIIADTTTTAERGSYVGLLLLFWGADPETWLEMDLLAPRYHDGVQARGVHRSAFDLFTKDRKIKDDQGQKHGKRKFHIPNPLKSILMLRSKGNLTVIMIGSITYLVKMTLQTSLAAQCTDIYDLDYLQAGLIYLPSGVGGAIASYTTGKFLDRNMRLFASRHGMNGQYRRGDDISNFPIEEARFVGIYTLVMLSALGTAGFGISLMKRTHIAVPLVMQFISGATTSSIFTLCGTLLTDLNPNASATVQASYNLVRCLGTAAAIASQQPLADAIGLGWCFSFFAFIMLSAAPLAMILTKWGPDWRRINLVNTTNDIR